MNSIDSSKKYKLSYLIDKICTTASVLEFLDLTLSLDFPSKQILVDVFSKSTNSFTCTMPSTYFPRINIEKA